MDGIFCCITGAFIFYKTDRIKMDDTAQARTNYENAVDKTVRITERVDNIAGTGTAVLNGQEWTARMQQDDVTLEPGELATVAAVEGVKLILYLLTKKNEYNYECTA